MQKNVEKYMEIYEKNEKRRKMSKNFPKTLDKKILPENFGEDFVNKIL